MSSHDTLILLQSMFPLPGELTLSDSAQEYLDSLGSSSPSNLASPTVIDLTISVELEPEYILDVKIELPLQILDVSTTTTDPILPTITLVQPAWLSSASFTSLESSVSLETSSQDDDLIAEQDPTAPILSFIDRLRETAPACIPRSTPTAASTSIRTSLDSFRSIEGSTSEGHKMGGVKDAGIICLSKMHHIVNQPKLRRLKALAETHSASGYVKSGRPGIMLYELESQEHLSKFLEGVRGLKYMEFHHLTSASILPQTLPSASSSATKLPHPKSKAAAAQAAPVRLRQDGKSGLIEVDDTKELIELADRVGRKDWFREALGMTGGGKG